MNRPFAWKPKHVRLLGTAPDEAVAQRIGISRATARRKRLALQIPAYAPHERRRNLAGQQFGDLTVLRFSRRQTMDCATRAYSRYYWICRCSCGRVAEYLEVNLIAGRTRSCGHAKFGMAAKRIREWREAENE